ncbi:MAG TPA: RNA-guided pseudouridylation complex pseudouridine synthase subunit Cbf5 [Methanoregulaceae archaeon]|nr:RNA-guided pseudouridylation complex pseudouridine synthase subunit Cbf5 [Methanoregulaceae archaeon]HQJ87802.1 RNA-guided pseudouridylation complex pseudouridine synthase subunit Cbf5 [Methanoregulaceae archaeon]
MSGSLCPGPGIVVIDKPRGPSSHQVAAWVGEILGAQVGHAGTLDPQVSGVLVVMLNRAVRLARLLLRHDKEYVCVLRLHGDADEARVREVAAEFVGRLYQRPPRRSAVKRQLRIRRVHALEVLEVRGRLVLFRVRCDAGTYIRSLCHHLGLAIGCGGQMAELRRTRSGAFGEEQAVTLHALKDAAVRAAEGDRSALASMVLPVEAAVPDLKAVVIGDRAVDAVCHGAALAGVGVLELPGFRAGETVALVTRKGELVALARTLVESAATSPGRTGLVAAPETVFMAPGTYPRGWRRK